MLTPAAFHELAVWAVNHGLTAAVTAAVLTAAFDADFNDRQDIPPAIAPAIAPATPPPCAPEVPAWRKRREKLKKRGLPANWRGRLDVIAPAIAPAIAPVAPLSPKKEDPKKEACKVAPVARATPPPGAHPLPEDWRPSGGRYLTAVQAGGETGAVNLIAKFRNHFHCRYWEIRTAAGWQARFSNWVITEWPDGKEPQLPMRRLHAVASTSLPPEDRWEAIKRRVHDTPRRESG